MPDRAWLLYWVGAGVLALAIHFTPPDSTLPWAPFTTWAREVIERVVANAGKGAGGGL